MNTIFESFVQTSCSTLSLQKSDFDTVTPNMISPFVLELPQSILTQAQNIVLDLYKLSQNENYQKKVAEEVVGRDVIKTTVAPLLCSLDVHVDQNHNLKIIEINTNASSYLITAMNYKARQIPTFPNALDDIFNTLSATLNPSSDANASIAIMDDAPKNQKLYIEFLMYKHLIEQNSTLFCSIVDPSQLELMPDASLVFEGKKMTSIYNRHTDFYLQNLPSIRKSHNSGAVLLSPHPWGYALYADKKRMMDLQNSSWCNGFSMDHFPHLKMALLKTLPFSHFSSAEDLWQSRHSYFFKPSESYGSKSVYNGKSISRKKFDEIFSPDLLAQEVAPAPEVTFNNNGTSETFKYDLRFYFFKDKIQLAFARTYRGQLTNLQTPMGGHAPLVFI